MTLSAHPLTLHAQLRPVAPATQPEAAGGTVEILTLPGAEITLDRKLTAKADAKGRAEFRGVKADYHRVEIFKEGHNTERKSFNSSTTGMTTVTVDLKAVIRMVSKGDFDTPKFVQERSLEGGYFNAQCSLAFSEDGRLLAAAGHSDLRVWDTDTGRELRHFEVKGEVTIWSETVAFAPDAMTLAFIETATGEVQIWSIATGELVRTISSCHGKGTPTTPAFSPALGKDGQQMAWACSDGIPIVETATGKEILRLPLSGPHNSRSERTSVQFSPDGKSLLVGTIGQTQIWDLKTGQVVRSFEYPGNHSAFNQDASWVALAGPDNPRSDDRMWNLRLREVATGNEGYTHELELSWDRKGPVRFSPHGRWVFSGFNIWDTNTGRLAGSIGRSYPFCNPAISQNWSRVARVDGDSSTIKILRRQQGPKPPAHK